MKLRIIRTRRGGFQIQSKHGVFGWKPLQIIDYISPTGRDNHYGTVEEAKKAVKRFKANLKSPEVVWEEDV